MKKIIVLICCFFTFQSAFPQLFSREKIKNQENFDKQFLTWGYFLGFNSYDFKFTYNENLGDVLVDKSVGFSVGLIGDMRINDHINIRLEPGIYFTRRDLNYPSSYGLTEPEDQLREVKSSYVHVPLLLKFSTKRINNFKPFVVGGFSTSLNLSSNEDNPDDNSNNQFRMKKSTYYYELGFGIDLYLHYFKFSPSIRGVFALNNELVPDADPNSPWTSNINKMQTRGVFINFTFQ